MSEEREFYENKIAEERSRSEEEYKKEIDKMRQELDFFKKPFKIKDPFNDSAILTNEEQRKFVISLFVGEVHNSKAIKLY